MKSPDLPRQSLQGFSRSDLRPLCSVSASTWAPLPSLLCQHQRVERERGTEAVGRQREIEIRRAFRPVKWASGDKSITACSNQWCCQSPARQPLHNLPQLFPAPTWHSADGWGSSQSKAAFYRLIWSLASSSTHSVLSPSFSVSILPVFIYQILEAVIRRVAVTNADMLVNTFKYSLITGVQIFLVDFYRL